VTILYLLEPFASPAWAPFNVVRPVSELRAGAWLIRERWEAAVGAPARAILSPHLAGFVDTDSPPVIQPDQITGPAVIARGHVVPPRAALTFTGSPASGGLPVRRLTSRGTTIAWRLEPGEAWNGPDDQGDALEVEAMVLEGAWQLIDALERLLAADCLEFTAAPADPVPAGALVLGDPSLVVCLDARVEPGVIFDTRQGAVVLTEGVEVRSGTRLEGPLFAGRHTRLLGGQIRHSSFGPECRVHGEMATSVMLGYGNKSHDGFVGHSVIGQWVNLGAGTITSNLKNTYGPVRLEGPTGRIETGRSFLGSLIADHAKLGIGTLLSTGTLVGAGAHLTGNPVPHWVAPFRWSDARHIELDAFLRIAARVMPRRGIAFTAEREEWLRTLHGRLAR
jgi:UDP-N-acetylglucosamine diphosphorylase/glucosamine-1-phosphate N-acetyltransferase